LIEAARWSDFAAGIGLAAKGQTTVPKAVRQALGVDYGGKIAYRIEEGRITVHNPEARSNTCSVSRADREGHRGHGGQWLDASVP
jgi:bifunctional DNA-binding transcriptional regulator/antitoxin component of YhaV-PrlF toxin-antitoxin module